MAKDMSYEGLNARKTEIMQAAIGVDYNAFELPGIGFDYERMMREAGYPMEKMREIQRSHAVGDTPLIELRNLTRLARRYAPAGKGARIFLKDEACNISGSFKARRASISLYQAKEKGYKGVICATSGNYGAAVAAQAALYGLKCIVVQECYDSRKVGQPEILEKQRICEAFGAEVVQLTVGPELFTTTLKLLEETGYFNASLYTPFGIAGIETLGYELVEQCRQTAGRDPDAVVCTNAGGGNITGTCRGVRKAGCGARMIGASIDLRGLHMASDHDFNRKSFTTGHTGFGMPFMTWPDRSDCPRNAARVLRHMDAFYLVKQGETFYITEALACLEGRSVLPERCPDLREHFVGELEDTSWEEVEARRPGLKRAYIEDWFHVTPPGGESPEEMAARVGRCVDGIVARGEDTLVAAHNGSLSLVLIHLGLAGPEDVMKPGHYFEQGCYTAVEVTAAGARLLAFNR